MSRAPEPAFPNGHFYSPVVSIPEARERATSIWPDHPEVIGIDFNDALHEHLLREVFLRYVKEYDYPEHASRDSSAYYTQNTEFSWLDSRTLFVLLRHFQPRRVIEVGSGFSTLLMADVNRRFMSGALHITAVEPFPRPFLRDGLPGLARLLEQKVQDVPLTVFSELGPGDLLFIDSSHVSKTGSDVNYLYFEVLPRLAQGVRIHIHDIFLPHDYPRDWIEGGRSWNEQYVLRALLMYSNAFRVLFGCSNALYRFPDLVAHALGVDRAKVFGGGSIWIEKTA